MAKKQRKLASSLKNASLGIVQLFRRFSEGHGVVYSSYLAFYLLLSIFPFMMVLVAVISFLPFGYDQLLTRLLAIFPAESHSYLKNFIGSISSSNWLWYSVLFLLWSSSRAVRAIQQSLDRISGRTSSQGFIVTRLLASLYNLLLLLLIILVTLIPTIIRLTKLGTLLFSVKIPYFLLILESLQWLFVMAFLYLLIAAIYMKMGAKKFTFHEVKWGALFTTISWGIMNFLFNGVVTLSRNPVYGALNVAIALLIWFQLNMNVLLLGAYINQLLLEGRERKHYEKT